MGFILQCNPNQWFLLPTILLDADAARCACGCGDRKSTVSIIFLCFEVGIIF